MFWQNDQWPRTRRLGKRRPLRFEPLGARELLASDLVITELATSGSALRDVDGDTSDWIEIHNPTDLAINLGGWSLTDDKDDLSKWKFPDFQLPPGGFREVFASGKDRQDDELHTNFKLRREGEYLALVKPDGSTIAYEYAPQFPPQQVGMSYGLTQAEIRTTAGAVVNVFVPTDDNGETSLGLDWTDPNFDDAHWTRAVTGVGFKPGGFFDDVIATDMQADMLDVNATVYARIPFMIHEREKIFSLVLGMRYDDGYVAYLNGVEVARTNAPDVLGPTSGATDKRLGSGDADLLNFENTDLIDHLHLLREGPNLLAIHGLNWRADDNDFLLDPELRIGHSSDPDLTLLRKFATPTPGAPNGVGTFIEPPEISGTGGLHDEPFDVVVSANTPGVTLVITTDGSRPSLESGIQIAPTESETPSTTIHISGTTVVKAAAFKGEFIPSTVVNRTYVFPGDVITQDFQATLDAGFPTGWGPFGLAPNYGNDPRVVGPNDAFLGEFSLQFEDSLRAIPTLSLVTDFENLFGQRGIFGHPEGDGIEWERPTSVELIHPDGSEGFQIKAGVRLQGANSRKANKKSLRLAFRGQYGATKLEFPFFGEDAADQFDTITLRAVNNDGWGHTPDTTQFIRDQWMRTTLLDMGQVSSHGTFVHLYINGIYWGVYHPVERPDASFSSSYFDGDKDEWDGMNSGRVINGSGSAWASLIAGAARVATHDQQASNAAYQRLLGNNPDGTDNVDLETLLDVDHYIDYLIANFYSGNTDWPGKNFYVGRLRGPESTGFKFYSWDAEFLFSSIEENVTGVSTAVTTPYSHLRSNDEFRLRFADRVHKHFFNGGALSVVPGNARWDPQHPERNVPAARYDQLARHVELPLVAESARWGDTMRLNLPYTLVEWGAFRDSLLKNYFPRRGRVVLSQLKSARLYPRVDAPSFSQFGGRVASGFQLEMTGPGDFYYTLDGTDPRRSSFKGGPGIAETAVRYEGSVPLIDTTRVKARALIDGEWSALTEAKFTVLSDLALRVTEMNYMPHDANPVSELGEKRVDNDRFEFIELANFGSDPIDLEGVQLVQTDVDGDDQGITFEFASQTLQPDEVLVVVRDRSAFESRYGSQVRIAAGRDAEGGNEGEYDGRLSNQGEQITLLDAGGKIVASFHYGTQGDWPARARGLGSSLELIDPVGDYDDPANWRDSSEFGGSPGQVGQGPDDRMIVNEVLAHTESLEGDRIELFNTTDSPIDVTNWFLSDSRDDYFKFQVVTPNIVPGGGYQTLIPSEFGLDLDGQLDGQLWMIEADQAGRPRRFVESMAFGASDEGVSLGRWPNVDSQAVLVPMVSTTFGTSNSGPAAGQAILSEIHYNPESLLGFRENFNDGAANPFESQLGNWNVINGHYQVVPVGKDDTISILPDVATLSEMTFSVTVNVPSVTDFNRNAAVIFDYHSPTDFKFASIHLGNSRWRIGERNAEGWNFLADERSPNLLKADTDIEMAVEIRGPVVRVRSNGNMRVFHIFDVPLRGGRMGMGSKNGQATFDEVVVEAIGDPQDLEFVELHNTSQNTLVLDGWHLSGTIERGLPAGTSLEAGQRLVVVGFDPSISEKARDFHTVHGVDPSVTLVGPFTGGLDNDGGTVTLAKPLDPVGTTSTLVQVDKVDYGIQTPWPAAADGEGKSLHRRTVDSLGTFSSSWVALNPTPGSAKSVLPGDLNGDGQATTDDIAALVLALGNMELYEATYGIPATLAGDADGDGDLDFDDIDDLLALLPVGAKSATRLGKSP